MFQKSKKRLKNKGVTLIELLIVFFIFSLVMVMVTDMARLAIASQVKTTDKVEARRLATIFLTKLRFELSTTRPLQSPPAGVGVASWWSPTSAGKLTLMVNANGGSNAVSYWLDAGTSQIFREKQGLVAPVLREVEKFEFRREVTPETEILKVQIKMRKFQQPILVWGRRALVNFL